jgi:hypothetical protein
VAFTSPRQGSASKGPASAKRNSPSVAGTVGESGRPALGIGLQDGRLGCGGDIVGQLAASLAELPGLVAAFPLHLSDPGSDL